MKKKRKVKLRRITDLVYGNFGRFIEILDCGHYLVWNKFPPDAKSRGCRRCMETENSKYKEGAD